MKIGPIVRGVGGLVAAYAVAFFASLSNVEGWLFSLLLNADASIEEYKRASELFDAIQRIIKTGYAVTLFLATVAMPVGLILRVLLRARVRARYPDPLAGVRRLAKTYPVPTSILLAVPSVLWFAQTANQPWLERLREPLLGFGAPALAVFAAQYAFVRWAWRAFIAPTVAENEDRTADGFTFQAVAVTRQTQAMVAGVGVLSVVMFGLAYSLPPGVLMRNPIFLTALFSYLAVAIGGAVFFVRASRISVGLDGVYISGTARARFVPFREIDNVQLNGNNVDLMSGTTRRVLRLQLHGEDALRRDALAERIRAAIARAEQQRDEPAVAFVASGDVEKIERAAAGASNYREVAPTREKLWEMLESPAVDAKGRAAAATALVRSSDDAERGRLRRMAEQCAEPTVRARIAELLEEDEVEEEAQMKRVRALR